jgi:EAL domain-containing protein (putative c-di-GMP-specific phosphodiesterase class I)
MSVNVTAENITSLFLPEQLKNLLKEYNIAPENLTLELTESAVMGHLTSSLDVLNRLRMKGFHLSIDDFGTGYSSLQQLYQAPFNELKIDRTFVSNMLKDKEALVIVEICIMLAKTLNMKVLAEGVEDLAILEKLKSLGCDQAQGYVIAKPMPLSDLKHWLNESKQRSPTRLGI